MPLSSVKDIETLSNAVRDLLKARRAYDKLSERAGAAGGKAAARLLADLNRDALHVNDLERVVHARAVDCGVADMREPEWYAPRTVKIDGWHEYQIVPAKPRDLAAALPSTSEELDHAFRVATGRA